MADQKKDMTGLMDYAKSIHDAGQTPPAPEGSVLEEPKVEAVEHFESLEDYSKGHPTPELPQEDAFVTTPAEPLTGLEASNAGTADLGKPLSNPVPSHSEPTFSPGGDDLSALQAGHSTRDLSSQSSTPLPRTPPLEMSPPSETPETHEQPALSEQPAFSELPELPDLPELKEPLRPAIKSSVLPQEAMERVKEYSEQMSPSASAVPASFPFSLLITGQLAPEEKERLTDLLARENMGFRELDLEPQFEAGKILIPRISEYAAILLVSRLRSTRAKLRLGPSDSIYASSDTQDSPLEDRASLDHQVEAYTLESPHLAEDLPITTESALPGGLRHAIVDIVTASAALKTLVVQAESSSEYQSLLEALQREIKYKAYRKGATAIVSFSVSLTQLHMPMHYRMMVTGSAVKPTI